MPDGGSLDLDTMLEHMGRIAAAVGVPVTADLESGYADVATTVRRAVEAGAVGGNLEDQVGGVLFGIDEAAERIAAARAAAPAGSFVLNARTDTWFGGASGDVFAQTVERAVRYVEAGADCVFVPGVVEEDNVRRLAEAIPAPLNIVAGLASPTDAPTLFSLGVKRVSLGGSLARAAYGFLERAGRELLDSGTLGFLDGAIAVRRPAAPVSDTLIAVVGGHGKTGRAVCAALAARGVEARPSGTSRLVRHCRPRWLAARAAYVIAPNLHPDEPAYVAEALAGADDGRGAAGGLPLGGPAHILGYAAPPRQAGVGGPGPAVGARLDDPAARRLPAEPRPDRPCVAVPYDVHAVFGFADLTEVAEVAAVVLPEDGHVGATYELASRVATVAELAAEAGVSAERTEERPDGWLGAMFAYYDRYGLPVGTRTMTALLGSSRLQ